ncbi:MAG: transglycosylase SLT domain-containing protein [Alphaproteobacteria bacterium]|nr:transglycosylase SLT domain-containing protein [Alphaproteobacteria bacterium]
MTPLCPSIAGAAGRGLRATLLTLSGLVLGLCLPERSSLATPLRSTDSIAAQGQLCARAVARAERQYRIPRQLLAAISLAESGRFSQARRATFAWPWTVRSGNFSRFLPTRAAAIATVRALQARGIRNIDVGCMQVNLGYHPKAFPNLAAAFTPARNVDYAARFLANLQRDKRSWSQAVAHYHSATRAKHLPYWRRVMQLWNKERRRAAKERRRRIIAEYEERRQKRLAAQARRRASMLARQRRRY